jgi:hypothetical protein
MTRVRRCRILLGLPSIQTWSSIRPAKSANTRKGSSSGSTEPTVGAVHTNATTNFTGREVGDPHRRQKGECGLLFDRHPSKLETSKPLSDVMASNPSSRAFKFLAGQLCGQLLPQWAIAACTYGGRRGAVTEMQNLRSSTSPSTDTVCLVFPAVRTGNVVHLQVVCSPQIQSSQPIRRLVREHKNEQGHLPASHDRPAGPSSVVQATELAS